MLRAFAGHLQLRHAAHALGGAAVCLHHLRRAPQHAPAARAAGREGPVSRTGIEGDHPHFVLVLRPACERVAIAQSLRLDLNILLVCIPISARIQS